MKSLCKGIGYAILVLGAIGSFFLAKQLGIEVSTYSFTSVTHYERNWLLSILYFIVSFLSSGIVSVIFFAISEVLEKLENVEYKITNNVITTAANENLREERMINNGGWKCSQCGRVNDSTVGSCACGATRQ